MMQFILTDSVTGKRLYPDMTITAEHVAAYLAARLEDAGTHVEITTKHDYDLGIYADQESFLWSEEAPESSKPPPQPGDQFSLFPL